MSVISLLILDPARLPSLHEVSAEAKRTGEPIEFTYDAELRTHTGFLPVRVHGRDTGFEHYFERVQEGALPSEATQFGSHHIVTRTGSDFEEGRAALAYLKVAARLSGGAYVYPDDAVVIPPEEVESYLNEQIATFSKYIT